MILVKIGVEIAGLTGLLSPGELALARFDVQVGTAAEGLAGLLTVTDETRKGIGELSEAQVITPKELERHALWEAELLKVVNAIDFTEAELQDLKKALQDFDEDGLGPVIVGAELTRTQLGLLADLMEHKLNVATNRTRIRLKEDLEDTLNDVEGQADDTAEAIDNMAEALLALTSPVFKAVRNQRKLWEAISEGIIIEL